MEYRGKHFSVVQGLDGGWKWSIQIDGHIRSGATVSVETPSGCWNVKSIAPWRQRRN
jgi:hypothetical protein